jgi:uncharacterized protein (UPF0147 family)
MWRDQPDFGLKPALHAPKHDKRCPKAMRKHANQSASAIAAAGLTPAISAAQVAIIQHQFG